MKPTLISLVALWLLFSCNVNEKSEMAPPVAEKIPFEIEAHGDVRVDNYYWMRDRESPKVIEYLEAENRYTDALLASTEDLQQELYDEMVARIVDEETTVPYEENGYWYYTRYLADKDYPIYCRKKASLDAEEEVYMDVNEMAAGYSYYDISSPLISPDGNIMAYGVDTVSRRKYTMYFKNLSTGEIYGEAIGNTNGFGAWADDNKTFFYTEKDPNTLRSYLVKKHKLGQDNTEDQVIFTEADETFSCYVYRSFSEKYIMIRSSVTLADEYHFLAADNPDGEFRVLNPRESGLEYSVSESGDYFYILTNYEGATNFKVMRAPVDKPGKENWETFIAHSPDIQITSMSAYKDFLAVEERSGGTSSIRIYNYDLSKAEYLKFEEEAYSLNLIGGANYDGSTVRYAYSSMTTPGSTFAFNVDTGERELQKQEEIKGGFDPAAYTTKRLWATARDGKKVPVSLVYRNDLKKDEPMPLLLYGYGSYGSTINPGFSMTRMTLVDRGFIYAIAHIRGSQMMGREWYEDGKMFNKMNTFTDFIDCGEFLIEEGYTTSGQMYAQGGSAGGLLMGAVINLAPDMFNGIIAAVPFVDVVTTMLDETIPLTTFEYDEWGNPNIQEQYEYIKSYSPYDNVMEKNYPNMLVTTGLHDSQVQYWEPAKWVAKLRDMKTDENLLLLHTNMEAGHGGASGRLERYKEIARNYAFLLHVEDLKK